MSAAPTNARLDAELSDGRAGVVVLMLLRFTMVGIVVALAGILANATLKLWMG
jgi:hypothetical protein